MSIQFSLHDKRMMNLRGKCIKTLNMQHFTNTFTQRHCNYGIHFDVLLQSNGERIHRNMAHYFNIFHFIYVEHLHNSIEPIHL